ncbi:MAG: PIN domain-containing protein [Bacteroidetes bacterium]|jgi:tRNA(fMet)-specific endonuclease VapC|nr:PIN domain-containing protein [Bacteroidota bacterium]MBK7138927.1 PIN domain-containing protein [Bacteroidota bacterium]MBK7640847.1 PIN domain-containing protein [Bacteroidota bacterium]MBK8674283.1 PIN domain-containing protein [Bacteroidota bacterium]MBK9635369.1 PIN domain-containing protein [Bacteroidota bacterium]
MKYLLDTNICVHFLRGKFEMDKILKEKGLENCYISEVTVLELRFGAENSKDKDKSHKAVDVFLKGIVIVPIYGSIKKYAEEKVRLNKIGKPQNDEFDLLIGVTAIENKLILVTENKKDFQNLLGIDIENWIVR